MLNPSNQGKIMDKRVGAGGIFAIIVGIITLGGVISISMMKRAVGTILIMLVGIYAVSNLKGDFFDMIKDFSAKSEASEIRQIELEREKLRLENETKLKILELEAKAKLEELRLESRTAPRQDRKFPSSTYSEDKIVNIAKETMEMDLYKFLEKTSEYEIYHKALPVYYSNNYKIVNFDIIVNLPKQAVDDAGVTWRSERYTIEVSCFANMVRYSDVYLYEGHWSTGKSVKPKNNSTVWPNNISTFWAESKGWQKRWAAKWCAN